nr:unnamed protein product [Timema tahoe]
MRNCPLE